MNEVICDLRFAICDLRALGGGNARRAQALRSFNSVSSIDIRFAVDRSNRKSQI